INVWPLNNVPGAVVNLMNPMNVDTVFIAGKVRKWRGSLVGVGLPRVLRLAPWGRGGGGRRAGLWAKPVWGKAPPRAAGAGRRGCCRQRREKCFDGGGCRGGCYLEEHVRRFDVDDTGLRRGPRNGVGAAARNEAVLGGPQIKHRDADVCQRWPQVGARNRAKA